VFISLTVISFLVKVHVLSLQIVVTAHKVSTEGSFFTITFFFESTVAQSARAIVIVVGSHSGTAEIATDTEYINHFKSSPSRKYKIIKIIIQIIIVIFATNTHIFFNSF
jgi:hypothetical protein